MSQETTTFGIDLGTTYSCISYLKDGHPTVCLNLEGDRTPPSVVRMMIEDTVPVVGKTAKDTSVIYPDDTIQFVKSKIGKVESFEIGQPDARRTVTPEQVSSEILKKLASDAEKYTNMPVKDVVITVPAYFGYNEREATKRAGIEAGLNVISIVEEPTAAAFYYLCEQDDTDATVCVYDLGGGTFDVTAIKKEGIAITCLTTDGDHDLGGKNWDQELIEHVLLRFREETGLEDEELDTDFLQELQIKCEEAKKQLSSAETASITLKYDRQHMANITVSRSEFNDITSALLQTTVELTRRVFDEVEGRGEKIDKLLLVGGSSKMPQVMEALNAEFGSRVDDILINEPDESVSKGACIFCAWTLTHAQVDDAFSSQPNGGDGASGDVITDINVNEENGEKIITIASADTGESRKVVIPSIAGHISEINIIATKSFGIKSIVDEKEVITNLIRKDQVLPAIFEHPFGTNTDNMTNVEIVLYQSEIKDEIYDLEYGIEIGRSVLDGLPAGLPAGSPVDIKIELNTEGIIVITGSYRGTPLKGSLNTNYAEGVGNQ